MGNRAMSQELIILGNHILDCRKEKHLSQETLAEKAEISPNTVSRIECGQMAMYVEIFMRIVRILGMDVSELLGVQSKGSGEDRELQAVIYQIQHLRKNERKIVLSSMEAMVNSIRKYRS